MDAQSWGVFIVVFGLVQVVLAGIFLRQGNAGKPSSSSQKTEAAGEKKNNFWIWVGRFGSACTIAGVLIILIKA